MLRAVMANVCYAVGVVVDAAILTGGVCVLAVEAARRRRDAASTEATGHQGLGKGG